MKASESLIKIAVNRKAYAEKIISVFHEAQNDPDPAVKENILTGLIGLNKETYGKYLQFLAKDRKMRFLFINGLVTRDNLWARKKILEMTEQELETFETLLKGLNDSFSETNDRSGNKVTVNFEYDYAPVVLALEMIVPGAINDMKGLLDSAAKKNNPPSSVTRLIDSLRQALLDKDMSETFISLSQNILSTTAENRAKQGNRKLVKMELSGFVKITALADSFMSLEKADDFKKVLKSFKSGSTDVAQMEQEMCASLRVELLSCLCSVVGIEKNGLKPDMLNKLHLPFAGRLTAARKLFAKTYPHVLPWFEGLIAAVLNDSYWDYVENTSQNGEVGRKIALNNEAGRKAMADAGINVDRYIGKLAEQRMAPRTLEHNGKIYTVRPIMKNPGRDIFMGDFVDCCLGMNSTRSYAMVERLIDEAMNVIEVVDPQGHAVACLWLYIAEDGSLVVQNLEIASEYENMDNKDRFSKWMIDYAADFASYIGAKSFLIGIPGHGKFFRHNDFIPNSYLWQAYADKKIEYGKNKIGKFVDDREYFLDTALKPEAFLVWEKAKGLPITSLGFNVQKLVETLGGFDTLLARFIMSPNVSSAWPLINNGGASNMKTQETGKVLADKIEQSLKSRVKAKIKTHLVELNDIKLVDNPQAKDSCWFAGLGMEEAKGKGTVVTLGVQSLMMNYLKECLKNNSPPEGFESIDKAIDTLVEHEVEEYRFIQKDPVNNTSGKFHELISRDPENSQSKLLNLAIKIKNSVSSDKPLVTENPSVEPAEISDISAHSVNSQNTSKSTVKAINKAGMAISAAFAAISVTIFALHFTDIALPFIMLFATGWVLILGCVAGSKINEMMSKKGGANGARGIAQTGLSFLVPFSAAALLTVTAYLVTGSKMLGFWTIVYRVFAVAIPVGLAALVGKAQSMKGRSFIKNVSAAIKDKGTQKMMLRWMACSMLAGIYFDMSDYGYFVPQTLTHVLGNSTVALMLKSMFDTGFLGIILNTPVAVAVYQILGNKVPLKQVFTGSSATEKFHNIIKNNYSVLGAYTIFWFSAAWIGWIVERLLGNFISFTPGDVLIFFSAYIANTIWTWMMYKFLAPAAGDEVAEINEERNQVLIQNYKWEPSITVYGSARIRRGHYIYELGKQVGAIVCKFGHAVRTGAAYNSLMSSAPEGYLQMRAKYKITNPDRKTMKTQGVNIILPFEQKSAIECEEHYDAKYFPTRKLGLYSNLLGDIALPGGFGTMEEVLETEEQGIPVIMVNKEFWKPILDVIDTEVGTNMSRKVTDNPETAVKRISLSDRAKKNNYYRITEPDVRRDSEELVSVMKKIKSEPEAVVIAGRPLKNSIESGFYKKLVSNLANSGDNIRICSPGEALDTVYGDEEFMAKYSKQLFAAVYSGSYRGAAENTVIYDNNIVVTKSITNHLFYMHTNAKAYVFLPSPGDIGAVARLFAMLTSMQTGKMPKKPIVLIGKNFWQPIISVVENQLLREHDPKLVSAGDFDLMHIVSSPEEALNYIQGINEPAALAAETNNAKAGMKLSPETAPKLIDNTAIKVQTPNVNKRNAGIGAVARLKDGLNNIVEWARNVISRMLNPLPARKSAVARALVDWHYVSPSGLERAVRQFGAAKTDANGEVHTNIYLMGQMPADPDSWGLRSTGMMVDGKQVWASTAAGALVVFAEGRDNDNLAETMSGMLLNRGKISASRKFSGRFSEFLRMVNVDVDAGGLRPGIIVDHTQSGRKISYNGLGSMVVTADLFADDGGVTNEAAVSAKLGELITIRNAESAAMPQNIYIDLDGLANIKEFMSNLEVFNKAGNSQMIVDPAVFAGLEDSKISSIAELARKSGVRICVDLSSGDSLKDHYRELGFAGYVETLGGETKMYDFASGGAGVGAETIRGYESAEMLKSRLIGSRAGLQDTEPQRPQRPVERRRKVDNRQGGAHRNT